MSLHSETK